MLSFKYVVEGWFMPSVSLFGIIGNFISMHILHHREVKLKKDYVDVLCMLATFDNLLLISTFLLFSLPTLSENYTTNVFPYTVPYLYPLTNIFMTSSGYMTAAVAVNRYLDIKGAQKNKRLKNGYVQASIVLLVSACINIPRWLEFEYKEEQIPVRNLTINGSVVTIFENQISAFPTKLRESNDYVRDYTLISATVLIVILPTLIMLISSYLIYRKMRSSSANVSFSTSQERARRRRNRNITLVLIGIIFLFLVCHIGEVAISIYELVGLLDEERKPFPKWANNIVIVNHLLIVINSSLNFVIYCKDVVFRRVFVMTYQALDCGKTPTTTAEQLREIKKESEGLGQDEYPEVVDDHKNLDEQSKILCGINQV